LIQNLVTSILAFVSTNIDDVFILMLFYSSARFQKSSIVAGQYLGITTLVVISFIASYIGSFVDQRYIGILGLFPIYLAIKQVVAQLRNSDGEDNPGTNLKSSGIVAIAGVTIANGADNLGVYIPLLTTMSAAEKIQLIGVFAIATYLWCRIAQYLASHPLIAKQLSKYGHVIMPAVLLLLGIVILFESRTFSLFID